MRLLLIEDEAPLRQSLRKQLEADGYRRQSDQSQGRLTASVGRRFGEDREVRLIAQAADVQQSVPGALTLTQALTTPRIAPAGRSRN